VHLPCSFPTISGRVDVNQIRPIPGHRGPSKVHTSNYVGVGSTWTSPFWRQDNVVANLRFAFVNVFLIRFVCHPRGSAICFDVAGAIRLSDIRAGVGEYIITRGLGWHMLNGDSPESSREKFPAQLPFT